MTNYQLKGAHISDCKKYRYSLWRTWDWQGPASCVMFVGLNPSKADAVRDDLTITKCVGFAKRWGYGGICMLNLFAFRATNPLEMLAAKDPVGPRNEASFSYYRTRVGLIVAAWGGLDRKYREGVQWTVRIEKTVELINKPIYCLGCTQEGQPRHPSRLAYATEYELWRPNT